MEEKILKGGGFVCLGTYEQLLRGGVSINPLKFMKKIMDYIADYGEDFIRGFIKGWYSK